MRDFRLAGQIGLLRSACGSVGLQWRQALFKPTRMIEPTSSKKDDDDDDGPIWAVVGPTNMLIIQMIAPS